MRRTTILNAKQVKRTSFSEAEQLFTKHCKLGYIWKLPTHPDSGPFCGAPRHFSLKYVSIPAKKCLAQRKNPSLPVTSWVFRYTLKNLSSQTMRYYAEDLKYFHACVPVQYVDAVSQDVFENFIVSELDAGKKITSLNSRIRGLRVFFKFCAEREWKGSKMVQARTTDGGNSLRRYWLHGEQTNSKTGTT